MITHLLKKVNNNKQLIDWLLLSMILSFFFLSGLMINMAANGEYQYYNLADSFLHGQLHLNKIIGGCLDCIKVGDKFYWPLGPFPAIVLAPLSLLINDKIIQAIANFLFTVLNLILLKKIAKRFNYEASDSWWLAMAFIFGSVYFIVAMLSWSCYFAQTITVFFLLLSIYEYLNKRRLWLIGLYFAFIFALRFTAGIGMLFFVLYVLTEKDVCFYRKCKRLGVLLFPCVISGCLLLYYNQLRFSNVWDNGYLAANQHLLTNDQRWEQINYGLFKIKNIPTNIYYYFLKGLEPITREKQTMHGNTYILKPPFIKTVYPSISYFIISPIFLFIFKGKIRQKVVLIAAITSIAILVPLLSYYWLGWRQLGPRYMLDLQPFLFLILLSSFEPQKLKFGHKLLIILSIFLNFYLFNFILPPA